ncbi:transcription/translation regulatory transformer protein RfaH [Candidatus Williamhamiltonella defendens]|uniref:Transcription antitermination protein RfaH n=1 Tax=Candidatus Hamiltonella defensa (Bemisia tabaci) TaxID=672795 RepID=A0A249DWB7_9ENTR|nr:transcription/translation regulatory transformer protein RfaH [Candidatus Hamiltonella defensa]ASX25836.1 transcriptional activator RfaH [Candidatus Hamiltonella defensa (Bemisia tabaci)]
MKSWYLLYCKRGQIFRAQEHLERQKVSFLTPLVTVEKCLRGRRIQVEEPLFPNYLFIHFDPEMIHTTCIKATRGVRDFVRFGNQLAVVSDIVITQIQQRTLNKLVDYRTPMSGDLVSITEGPFFGLQAIYSERDGEMRSILLINLLHQQVSKSFDNHQFQKK